MLYAIGIRYVGETTAKVLARHFGTMDALMNATFEQLCEVEEVGEAIAGSVTDFFAREQERQIVSRLKEASLVMEYEEKKGENLLEGKSWVISGTFSRSREEMKRLVEYFGGKMLSGISSKTDYLLAGEKMGAEKRKKAEKEGIPLISEAEFYAMIGGEPAPDLFENKETSAATSADEAISAQAAPKPSQPVQGSLFD